MRRAFPAVLVLVLVVAAPLTAAVGTSDAPADSEGAAAAPTAADRSAALQNETRLGLDGTARYNYTRPTPSFGTAVAGVDAELRTRYRRELAEVRVAAAAAGSQAPYARAAADVEAEVNAMRARERAAVRSYANGSITETELARVLARQHAHAVAVDRSVRDLRLLASDDEVQDRLRDLQGRLETFQSPVRGLLLQSVRGEGTTPTVFVAATDDGAVLAAVDDGAFYREAIRYDYRQPDQPPSVSTPGNAIDRIGELYPETETPDAGISGLRRFPSQQLFRVEIDHPAGPTQAYLDMATARVFSEKKRQPLSALSPTTAVNQTTDGLRVVVNRTAPTGAMEIRVYDADTGEPVDARIGIDGDAVGATGADGRLWTVEPLRTYTINATSGDESATVVVSPQSAQG